MADAEGVPGDLASRAVGFVGLGVMGGPMAANLASAGLDVVAFDVDDAALARCAAHPGVRPAASPAAVSAVCGTVFTCLPSEAAVRTVYWGESGILSGARPGLVTCECSTISPQLSEDLAGRMADAGVRHIETVLIGRRSQAESGQIFFIVSGDRAVADAVAPLLAAMGREWRYLGANGAASRVKLLQNALGYISAIATTEILALARASGVDPVAFAALVNEAGGIGGSTYFREHAEDVALGRDSGSGRLRIAAKDMHLVMELAEASGLPLPVLADVDAMYAEAVAGGFAEDEYTATWRVMEARAGRRLFGR